MSPRSTDFLMAAFQGPVFAGIDNLDPDLYAERVLDPNGLIGQRIGPYRVQGLLGHGGMAVVYRAIHLELDRAVALKMMLEDTRHDPEAVSRFRREARLLKRLAHPGIVRILQAGRIAGRDFYAMEIVEHPTLEELLQEHGGKLPFRRALRIVRGILRVLAHVHRFGVVHGDLKPSNLFVTENDRVILADFGLSEIRGPDGETGGGRAVAGTGGYMAPEQLDGRSLDGRTDLYAVGVLLHRLLGARREGDGTLGELPVPPGVLEEASRRRIQRRLDLVMRWIRQATRTDPDHRFLDARRFEEAIAHQRPEGTPVSCVLSPDTGLPAVTRRRGAGAA